MMANTLLVNVFFLYLTDTEFYATGKQPLCLGTTTCRCTSDVKVKALLFVHLGSR